MSTPEQLEFSIASFPVTPRARRCTNAEKSSLVAAVDGYCARGWAILKACKACGISFPSYKLWKYGPKRATAGFDQRVRREFERVNAQLTAVGFEAEPTGSTPIDALVAMYGAIDAELQQEPVIARCIEAIRNHGVATIQELIKKDVRLYVTQYRGLSAMGRDLVCRALRIPQSRWFSTYYPVMSEAAWTRYAACFVSKSTFDTRGGVWLSKNQPEWYRRICETGCAWWYQHKALDGFQYASRAELIVANLLFVNGKTLSYTQMPVLPFVMRRNMRADFELTLRDPKAVGSSGAPAGRYCVEVWGWSSNREDSPYIARYLERRNFKLAHLAEYPAPLIQIEAEVLRFHGPDAFLRHILHRFKEAGIRLPNKRALTQSTAWKHPREWPPEQFAAEFRRFGCRTVSAATRHSHRRVKMLANLCVQELRCVAAVERELARLWGRMARIRKDWQNSLATKEEVARYVKEHGLAKGSYTELYKARHLPEGFPSSPFQTYEGWSWRAAKRGVATRDIIRDYESAKAFLNAWQSENRPLLSGADFGRAYEQEEQLRFLPKLPDHPVTGLKGWVNWADFLGHACLRAAAERNARNRETADSLLAQSGTDILEYLQSLGCTAVSQLHRTNWKLYRDLVKRPDYQQIKLAVRKR